MIWNASVGLTVNIDYDDIEADTDNPIVYCCYAENKEREPIE